MRGIYSALLGAFDSDGKVDVQGVHELVRHNIAFCHVDGLYVNGSTGENFLMTTEAKKQMLKAVAEAANGEVRLIAHVGSNVLEEALELSHYAAELGYDAVSAVTPFYYKFSAEEIKGYYRTIASQSPLPLVAYYIPALTGIQLRLEDIEEILRIPNIIGIKFTSNDFFILESLRSALPDKLFFSGYDEMLLSAAVLGVDGAIGSTYNCIGHWAKQVIEAVGANDLKTARTMQHHMNVVIRTMVKAGIYPTLKALARLYGVSIDGCKPPMQATTDVHREAARRVFEYIRRVDEGQECVSGL
ncbi:MAG TPA: N-acetylneuraminate lyase [Firmicutes bacterium]|nr:N-acetylneuraminate lyase [Bacillota bacterium]